MALPSSGPISTADIAAELGVSTVTIPDTDTRLLTGISSGPIILPDDFWGKSMPSVTETDNRTTAATSHSSVSFGATDATRWIVVLATHGDTGTDPGSNPTCTIGGGAATRTVFSYVFDGGGNAVGSAMFVAQPSGTSGTVAVSWGGLATSIIVLRVTGYNLASSHDIAFSSLVGSSLSLDVPNAGLLVGFVAHGGGAVTWTGITKRGTDSTDSNSKTRSRAWDLNLSAESGKTISFNTTGFRVSLAASFARP